MRQAIVLNQLLRRSIDDDIAERTKEHQAKVAALQSGRAALSASGAPAAAEPLIMLAHGDSWFDYPLDGNDISLHSTDIIAQLSQMGDVKPLILNVSHFGDATTTELALPKQQRLMAALSDPKNWGASGKPDAILFSGGGDDMAGDQFCIYLDENVPGSNGLDASRFEGVLGSILASYRDLFVFRDRHASGVPIFGHTYDFPIPNGVHPVCSGPWLQPSLSFAGWTELSDGVRILHDTLQTFANVLSRLATPENGFSLVDTQGTLAATDWANELHPTPSGFQMIANRFLEQLRLAFPGRI